MGRGIFRRQFGRLSHRLIVVLLGAHDRAGRRSPHIHIPFRCQSDGCVIAGTRDVGKLQGTADGVKDRLRGAGFVVGGPGQAEVLFITKRVQLTVLGQGERHRGGADDFCDALVTQSQHFFPFFLDSCKGEKEKKWE